MENKPFWKSKKIWVLIVNIIIFLLNKGLDLGFTETDTASLFGLSGAYMLGDGMQGIGNKQKPPIL